MDSASSRYAIALLSIAREENKIKEYIEVCEQIYEIISKNNDLYRIIKDYGLSCEEKKETLDLCFKGKIPQYILNLFYVVIDNNRGKLIKEILQDFIRIAYKDLKIRQGIVYSTTKLSSKEIENLQERVSDILSCQTILINEIDESLVGGFKIKVDDLIIDESIKTRFEKLKLQLLSEGGYKSNGKN